MVELAQRIEELFRLDRPSEAGLALRAALSRGDGTAEDWCRLGLLLGKLGRHAEALLSFDRAVALEPQSPQLHLNLGVALVQSGKVESGSRSMEEALKLRPDYPEAHLNLANAHASAKRYELAEKQYLAAITARPDWIEAILGLGKLCMDRKTPREAVVYFQHATRIAPNQASAWIALGSAAEACGQFVVAESALIEAVRLRPLDAEAIGSLANFLKSRQRLEEALALYQIATCIDPQNSLVRFNRSLAILQAGDTENGWAEYEWRLRRPDGMIRCPSRQPRWSGEAATGQRILLWAEQGLGDTIQFSRFASIVAESCAAVFLFVPAILSSLMESIDGVTVVREGDPLPDHDLHCPLMSLPLILGPAKTKALRGSYLRPKLGGNGRWLSQLAKLPGHRIGLYWQGNPHHPWDRHRSLRLEVLRPLLSVAEASFVALQQGPGREQSVDGPLFRFSDEFQSISDLAEAMMGVDLVISVDTAAAHLAGALGRPVWVLLSQQSDWRWRQDEGVTDWYDSARIYRQQDLDNWSPLIERVLTDLRSHCNGGQKLERSATLARSSNRHGPVRVDSPRRSE